ncbi:uncharacterized protein LOC143083686 isoform X2 [Mytilus galloprovincialis]|uniref:uncharacterized protein LOC143083686 isoform X2 n=1 Tax=Mytilus galloprovincialis TaxID=29158 RepID=UPI003F7BBE25
MLESFPLLIILSIVGNVVSLGNGPGVCSRTERQTVDRVVTKEVYVGTTEIPCIVNSWLDELSCMNRKTKTINVTEHRNETVQEIVPMVIKFCCAGYTLVGDRCILQTTTTTTTTTERMTTTSTVKVETTQPQTTTIPTTIKPTTIKPTTQPQTTIKLTTRPQTTVKPTTQQQTTIKLTTQPQTTIKPTTVKPEITTIKKSETTVPPKSTKSVLTTSETTITDIAAITESKVTLEAKVKPKPITSDIAAADRTTHIPNDEKDISPDSSSKSVDTRDLLLYVSAACGLLSFITMIVVVGICYQRSKRNNNRFHNDILSMETVRVNGLNQMHGVENPNYKQQNESECVEPINYREKKQNCNNVYTEMRLTGANQYDDLVGIEEDPYDELPDELPGDYQDCDASPRLYKTSVSPENPYDVSKY